ncbi:MAG: DUF1192 domain-containing protein [Sphingopyxis sp.]
MDDDAPLRPDDPLVMLQRQDIDRLSLTELDERIAALEAEIVRVKARKDYAVNHKASAEALFKS